jgi:hypothetical protein
MNVATLKLFNAVLTEDKDRRHEQSPELLKRMITNGYILDPAVEPNEELLSTIEDIVGISGEKANASFHKSWGVVRDTPMEVLVIQQMMHYITTYGFEAMGVYNEDFVYVPSEELEVPEIKEDVKLIVVRGLDKQELLDRIISLGGGIALAEHTLRDIMTIVKTVKYDPGSFVYNLRNRELMTRLFDYYGVAPAEPEEFLRHVVYKLAGSTLLIKNSELINSIAQSEGVDELMEKAPENLASVFFRYKPLFLAMKKVAKDKNFFNRLRKNANLMHKPIRPDYLSSVTNIIKSGKYSDDKLMKALDKASVFRKVRLAYALLFRANPADSIVYRVRNGKAWATDFEWPNKAGAINALPMVVESIAGDIKDNVAGKAFLIPSCVKYALPATEKQFTGSFPTGTFIEVDNDLITGIHWFDTENRRIDLDLSTIDVDGRKTGWDASYRDAEKRVLFSGDLTAAPRPKGATELFYFGAGVPDTRILFVNYFSYDPEDPVECKIVVASDRVKSSEFDRKYMIDQNKIIAQANITIERKSNIIGMVSGDGTRSRVYFAQTALGNSITSSSKEHTKQAIRFFANKTANTIGLNYLLKTAGAKIVSKVPEEGDYIDLSPEALDKTTIIDLLQVKR